MTLYDYFHSQFTRDPRLTEKITYSTCMMSFPIPLTY